MNRDADKQEKAKPTNVRVLVYRDIDGKREFLILKGVTGRYALIGGMMDDEDTTLEDTIKRELLEEVGYELGNEKIINTGITREFIYTAHNDRMGEKAVDLNFIIKLDPKAELRKTDEICDFYWMTFEEACEKISFEDLREVFIKLQKLL